MSALERFRGSFHFDKVDRLPIYTFGAWKATIERWLTEGLPQDWAATNYFREDRTADTGVCLGSNALSPLFPPFERTVQRQTETHVVLRDEHGKLLRRKRGEADESIAEYLEFPMRSRSDWEALRRRLDPALEDRYSGLEHARGLLGAGVEPLPVVQRISGAYRILWHLLGDVGLAYALYDDPELVHAVLEQWRTLMVTAIGRICGEMPIHVLDIREDMSCNTGMMVSPAMFRSFMMPYYKELIQEVKKHPSLFGVWVDSDGDVEELIPLLLECGVDGMFPFEVQAGMDVVALRRKHPRLVIRGGIDKRELTGGKEAIDRELDRVLPCFLQTGGYFICLDHSVPPEVPLDNYLYFLEQAADYR